MAKTRETIVEVKFKVRFLHDKVWSKDGQLGMVCEDLISHEWPEFGWSFKGIHEWSVFDEEVTILPQDYCKALTTKGDLCGRKVYKASLCKECHDAERIKLTQQFKKIKASLKEIGIE